MKVKMKLTSLISLFSIITLILSIIPINVVAVQKDDVSYINRALDSQYTLSVDADSKFPETLKGYKLTDGKKDDNAPPNYLNQKYVGFYRYEYDKALSLIDIILDLGEACDIETISTQLLKDRAVGIGLPGEFQYSVSLYGNNFESVKVFGEDTDDSKIEKVSYKAENVNKKAQYIKISFEIGYWNGSWGYWFCMFDEIEVFGKKAGSQTVENLALERPYKIISSDSNAAHLNPHKDYLDFLPSPTKLTDGKLAKSTDINDPGWQGHFEDAGKSREIIIELKDQLPNVAKINVNFLKNKNSSPVVNLPEEVKVFASTDNATFNLIDTLMPALSDNEGIVNVEWAADDDSKFVKAKYIKIEFSIDEVAFLDEIQIMTPYKKSQGLNGEDVAGLTKLSNGLDYTITPAFSSSYPDKDKYLTDGKYANSGSFLAEGWVGNNIENPNTSYIFDLGEERAVGAISFNSLHMTSVGIGIAAKLDFLVSDDGENWKRVYSISEPTPSVDSSVLSSWIGKKDGVFGEIARAVKARYVCVRAFSTSSWLFVDEIEIWGDNNLNDAITPPEDSTDETGYLAPTIEATNGIKNLVLAYNQGYEDSTGDWTKEKFQPYLTYKSLDGKVTDEMFDAVLFIALNSYYEDGEYRYFGVGYGGNPSDKRDWDWYLEKTLGANGDMAALNEAAIQASKDLNDPDYKVKAVLTIPMPDPTQTNFGKLTSDGTSLNFSLASDQKAAIAWYVKSAREMFENGKFDKVELAGLYWLDEHVGESDLIGYASNQVHQAGNSFQENDLKFFWIPYYGAGGVHLWKELGFDAVAFQPNHYFHGGGGYKRIEYAAETAKSFGLGIEMENGPEMINKTYEEGNMWYERYLNYLDGAVAFEFQGPHVFRAYYQWVTGFMQMAKATDLNDPFGRYAYDLTYKLMKGTLKQSNRNTALAAEIDSVTDQTIAVKKLDGYEYTIDGANWQTSPVFSNLAPETEYIIWQRIAQTENNEASLPSTMLSVSTEEKMEPAEFLITFDVDGKKTVISAVTGEKLKMPVNPEKAGFEFKGWFSAASGGIKVTEFSSDMTVYAQWELIKSEPSDTNDNTTTSGYTVGKNDAKTGEKSINNILCAFFLFVLGVFGVIIGYRKKRI